MESHFAMISFERVMKSGGRGHRLLSIGTALMTESSHLHDWRIDQEENCDWNLLLNVLFVAHIESLPMVTMVQKLFKVIFAHGAIHAATTL